MNPLTAPLPFVCPRDPGRRFLTERSCSEDMRQVAGRFHDRVVAGRSGEGFIADRVVGLCQGCHGPVRALAVA